MKTSKPDAETIFDAARQLLSSEDRAAYLRMACGSNDSLRTKIEGMLQAEAEAKEFLRTNEDVLGAIDSDGGLIETVAEVTIAERPGTIIDEFKLLQQIGEGGFGVVYMAEQQKPVVRKVALKIIKLGLDTKQVIARFEAERQALALMDHPNISKVLGAGSTDSGRPYFCMELVHGVPITRFCDENGLSTEERLRLFSQVCSAIQHAHQKGVIHRDIKPSNVLVTLNGDEPVPKVIDFGIAKATRGRFTEKTLFTHFQQFMGTPAYMSPEQAQMSATDVDTRSDIYSLGVLLYELLTGKTPLDANELMRGGYDEIRRRLREDEPVKPSTRLSTMIGDEQRTVAKQRRCEVTKLNHLLRGDLDWIVMKCLEKDRTRRYETANGLAMDLKRHLNNELVIARPPSAAYKFQKAWRRNKVIYSAGLAVVLALLAGISVSAWQAVRASQARDQAELAEAAKEQERLAAMEERNKARAAERRADQLAEEARRNLYASDINLAQQAVNLNNLGRARRLLERHRPDAGERDLRGWEWRFLWQKIQSDELQDVGTDPGIVWFVALSSKRDRVVASATGGRVVRVRHLRSGEVIELAHPQQVKGLAFSPDGAFLATGCADKKVRFWNYRTGAQSMEALPHANPILDIALTSDGSQLAVATQEDLVIWKFGPEAPTIKRRFDVQKHDPMGLPSGFEASPDGRWVAMGTELDHVVILDLDEGDRLKLQLPDEDALDVAFSPDSRTLATVDYGGNLCLFELQEGQWQLTKRKHRAHDVWISSVAFLRDRRALITTGADQLIKFWNADTLESEGVLKGHHDEIWSLDAASDGTLVTGSKDGEIKLWSATPKADLSKKTVVLSDVEHLYCTSARSFVGALDSRSSLSIYETTNLDIVGVFQLPTQAECIALANEHRVVAAGGVDGVISVFRFGEKSGSAVELRGHTGSINSLEFSHDGRWLISNSDDRSVRLWDIQIGKEVMRIDDADPSRMLSSGSSPFSFSRDDELFTVHNSATWTIELWSTSETRRVASIPFRDALLSGVAIIPGHDLLVTSGTSGHLTLHEVSSRKEQAREKSQLLGLHALALSPDASRIAVGTTSEGARLWSADIKSELLVLEEDGEIANLAFSQDGNSLIADEYDFNGKIHKRLIRYRAPSWEQIQAAEARERNDFSSR